MASKGATKHCCWGKCNSDSRYADRLPTDVFFIRFTKPGNIKEVMTNWEKQREGERTEKCKRWVHACGRRDFSKLCQVKKDTYICSLHFVGENGPTDDNPDPLIATLSEEQLKQKSSGKRKVPKSRTPILKKRAKLQYDSLETNEDTEENFDNGDMEQVDEDDTIFTKNKYTQTIYEKTVLGSKIENIVLRNKFKIGETSLPSIVANPMSPDIILKDQDKCKYFIGLYPDEFDMLFNFLGPSKYELTYWKHRNNVLSSPASKCLSVRDQLFVTLLRLRRGFNLSTLAHMYSVSDSYISNIFTTWIMFLYQHFKDYETVMFPERQVFKQFMPKVFKKFKNIRASIDCTEFFCEVPRDYGCQGNMYSSYKHHTTMKCLIAVNPNGAACFVSDLYEGSVDDVRIYKTCGLMNHVNPGDSFLVDKGFTVQDVLLSKQATIFIPPFLGKRDSLTKEEIMLTKRIAKARIHVERFNERLKKFRLICGTIPLVLSPMASQLVYVSCCLVNFQDCLCK